MSFPYFKLLSLPVNIFINGSPLWTQVLASCVISLAQELHLYVKILRMDIVELMDQQINELETIYAELLADGATYDKLAKIWKQIKELRIELELAQPNKRNKKIGDHQL